MAMNSNISSGISSEINVTPMIDVLLVLLIIFMLIVPVMSNGEGALLPKPSPNKASTGENAVVLEVLRGSGGEPSFRINQQSISREDLPSRLATIYAGRAKRVLFVKADDELPFTQVAEAIDISHAAGIDRVGLITPKVQAGL